MNKADWAPGTPKRIVVAGEFNAGKSSTINLLLRREVQAAAVDPSMMPPTLIVPSETETLRLVTTAGGPGDAEAFRAGEIDGEELSEVEIGTGFGALTGVTITEVSVDLDGGLNPRAREILEAADLLIWCTMGQRAWALTEIAVVETLPAALHETAILVTTRADYLRTEEARELVRKRLETQASPFFRHMLQVSAGRKAVLAAGDDASWAENGGRALHDAVLTALTGEHPAQASALAAVQALWRVEIDSFSRWLHNAAAAPASDDVVHRLSEMLFRVIEIHRELSPVSPEAEALAKRFEEVRREMTRTLGARVSEDDTLRCLDLILKLEDETRLCSGGAGLGAIQVPGPDALRKAS